MAAAGKSFPDSAFWDFSLEVYRRPGVAEACLALQARHGLDVNLLLFCCWAGRRGRVLCVGDFAGLEAAVGDWHRRVVQPLREVRRWLRDRPANFDEQAKALRAEIKGRELDAEHIEQLLLDRALPIPPGAPSAAAAAGNLEAYLTSIGAARGAGDTADIGTLLRGAFPEIAPDEAERLGGRPSRS